MKMFEAEWQSGDGLHFYGCGWEPDGKIKASIALVHGLGEHVGRYARVGEAFANAGYALMGFDLRGHGKSGGPRGHTPGYDILMDDVALLLEQIETRYTDLPGFLYGHSLGGNLVLNYALRRRPRVTGVIVTSPWLKLAFEPPVFQVTVGRLMNRIAPGFTQNSGLETAALSRDPEVVKAYVNDPLVHDKITARLFVELYESGLWALEHASDFPLPLLLMCGTGDRIISAEAGRQFAERGGEKVTWLAWDGWYHEIHNEPEKTQVLTTMFQWMSDLVNKK